MRTISHKTLFSLAPMMGVTHRHFRYFLRLISPRLKLYTEMITAAALVFGKAEKFLSFDPLEHPVVLQLGGSDPKLLKEAALKAEAAGYDEINLNVGCPSDRVQAGRFGACLMLEPDTVAQCIEAIKASVTIPVTVKTRIGVDHHDKFEFLEDFIRRVANAGCKTFVIHARKAWLKGLNPKQNREIPPLEYDKVFLLKTKNPHLEIVLNGGLTALESIESVLSKVDGVMLGRKVEQDPYWLSVLEKHYYNYESPSREDIVMAYLAYMDSQAELGPQKKMFEPLIHLYHGESGARFWRKSIVEASLQNKGWEQIPGFLERMKTQI